MLRLLFIIFILFFSSNLKSNESLLTIQQQLERLQREVSDLSQTIYLNNESGTTNSNKDVATNLSAIDMRIYDLEKDVKNLTANLEDVYFKLEDIILKIDNFENNISMLQNSLNEDKNIKAEIKESQNNEDNLLQTENNTLGSLKISSGDENNNENISDNSETKIEEKKLSPEDEFQIAFDNIRKKNWDDAESQLIKFIENNSENQLSGSAHYWLGELYILKEKYRDAALVFAEGYQSFPESIKAPDMLYKLSESLYRVSKIEEACKTLEKLIIDYPKNKFIKTAKKQLLDFNCLEANE